MHSHPAEQPSTAKVAKGLAHYAMWHLAVPWLIEYSICLLATIVINAAFFHGRLNTPVAAVGVFVIGILGRYFLAPSRHSQASQEQQAPFIMSTAGLPPGFLDGPFAGPSKDERNDRSPASPYL